MAVGIVRGKPIDLGYDSDDEMNLAAFGITKRGPIALGSDSVNETKISTDMVAKMKRTLTTTGLQELEEINQSIQVENTELRGLLQEANKEKQMLLCQLQAKDEAFENI